MRGEDVHLPPSGRIGLMLGEILGRSAGLTRLPPLLPLFLVVLAADDFPAGPAVGVSGLFMPCGPCGDVTALECGDSLVDCEVLDDCAVLSTAFPLLFCADGDGIPGVLWLFLLILEDFSGGGGAAASGSFRTSMPLSRAEVAGLAMSTSAVVALGLAGSAHGGC